MEKEAGGSVRSPGWRAPAVSQLLPGAVAGAGAALGHSQGEAQEKLSDFTQRQTGGPNRKSTASGVKKTKRSFQEWGRPQEDGAHTPVAGTPGCFGCLCSLSGARAGRQPFHPGPSVPLLRVSPIDAHCPPSFRQLGPAMLGPGALHCPWRPEPQTPLQSCCRIRGFPSHLSSCKQRLSLTVAASWPMVEDACAPQGPLNPSVPPGLTCTQSL